MATMIDIRELPARFAELLALAGEGGEVVVTDRGIPRAILLPITAGKIRDAGLDPEAMQAPDDSEAQPPDDPFQTRW